MNCIQRVENSEDIKLEDFPKVAIPTLPTKASKIFEDVFSNLLDFRNNKKDFQTILESREVIDITSLTGTSRQLKSCSKLLDIKVALFSEDRILAQKSFIMLNSIKMKSQGNYTEEQQKFMISLSFYDAMMLYYSRGQIKSVMNHNRLFKDLTKIKKMLRSKESRDFAVEKDPKWPPPKVLFGAYLIAIQIFEDVDGCFILDTIDIHKLIWASQIIYNQRFSMQEDEIDYIQVQAVAASIYFLCKYNLLNINEMYELDRKLYDLYLPDVSLKQLEATIKEFKKLPHQRNLIHLFKSILSEWTLVRAFYFKYSKESGSKPLPILTPDPALFIKSNSSLALICFYFKNKKKDCVDYAYYKKFLPKFLKIYIKFSCLEVFLAFRLNQARCKEGERLKDITADELDNMTKEQLEGIYLQRVETNYFKDVLSNIKIISQEVELDEDTIEAIKRLDSLASSIEISSISKSIEVDSNTLEIQNVDVPSASAITSSSAQGQMVSNSKEVELIASIFDFKTALMLIDENLLKRAKAIKDEISKKLAQNETLLDAESKFLNSSFAYEIMIYLFHPNHVNLNSLSIYVESKLQIIAMLQSDKSALFQITNKCLLGAFFVYVKTKNKKLTDASKIEGYELNEFLGCCMQIYESRLNIEPSKQSYFDMIALSAAIYFLCEYKKLDYERLPLFEQKLKDFMVLMDLAPSLLRGFFSQYQGYYKPFNNHQKQKKLVS